jgi:ribA/ribD-fused uncharacterized protein
MAQYSDLKDQLILFYGNKGTRGKDGEYSEFSNFFRHARSFEFHLPSYACHHGFPSSVWCNFSEKAIMATKAALFQDLEILRKIDAADDPFTCKELGRRVRNFDDKLWKRHLEETAFEVVRQKFAADRRLRDLLLSTGSAVIAEASPNDMIWGIGLNKKDKRAKDLAQWRGRNILGLSLMRAREHFRSGNGTLYGTSAVGVATGFSCTPAAATAFSALAEAETLYAAAAGGGGYDQAAAALSPTIHHANSTTPAANADADGTIRADAEITRSPQTRRWGRDVSAAATCQTQAKQAAKAHSCHSKNPKKAVDKNETRDGADDRARSEHRGWSYFDCFVVLDFEATCGEPVQPKPQEIIEFPMVLVDVRTGAQVAEFRTYVRPTSNPTLTEFCKNLTGIQQEDVESASIWSDALKQGLAWLDTELQRHFDSRRFAFVTCGDWDLKTMLPKQCATASQQVPARFKQWINIKYLFERVTGKPGKGMVEMLRSLQLKLEGHHHSGLHDCRNIARILRELIHAGAVIDDSILSSASTW